MIRLTGNPVFAGLGGNAAWAVVLATLLVFPHEANIILWSLSRVLRQAGYYHKCARLLTVALLPPTVMQSKPVHQFVCLVTVASLPSQASWIHSPFLSTILLYPNVSGHTGKVSPGIKVNRY